MEEIVLTDGTSVPARTTFPLPLPQLLGVLMKRLGGSVTVGAMEVAQLSGDLDAEEEESMPGYYRVTFTPQPVREEVT